MLGEFVPWSSADLERLETAAIEVLRSNHAELLRRRPGPLQPHVATELANQRQRAVSALTDVYGDRSARGKGHKEAKETVTAIAGGVPLAICIGPRVQRAVQTWHFIPD